MTFDKNNISKKYLEKLESTHDEIIFQNNNLNLELCNKEHQEFVKSYQNENCYLCNKPFKTISKTTPCLHWLLRECKFKKKNFPDVFKRFDYHQISSFLRWIGNQERYLGNINDMSSDKRDNKIFEYTIKWKNIEWTFDCSKNDYIGHSSKRIDYPHYHFQMKIDKKPFISFGDFHIPFSEDDLIKIETELLNPNKYKNWYGPGGCGMQDAIEADAEEILSKLVSTDDENKATFRIQTMILDTEKIAPEIIQKIYDENKRTGETMASLCKKYLPPNHPVKTTIEPANTVPSIAHRTEHKKR